MICSSAEPRESCRNDRQCAWNARRNRPQVKTTIQNVNALTERMLPLLEDFRKTSDEANQALTHIDALVARTVRTFARRSSSFAALSPI